MQRTLLAALLALGIMLGLSAPADAGLIERLKLDDVTWLPVEDDTHAATLTLDERLQTPPATPKLLDERWEPIVLVRTLYVTTMQDSYTVTDANGQTLALDSRAMDPAKFGHREGFVLENVELGMKGRFNDQGLYYKVKFELIPREKDGNRSSDYLKDAYFGWNTYRVFDVRAGRMKIPFSQANLQPTEYSPLIYKPLLNVLTPKRQLGLMVGFADPWEVARLRGGVFNSVSLAVEQMKDSKQLMYVARLDFSLGNLLKATNTHFMDFEFDLGGNIAYTKENFDPTTEHRWTGLDASIHLWIFTLKGELMFKDFYSGDVDENGVQPARRGIGWHADLIVHAWPEVIDVTGRIEQMDGEDDFVRGESATLSIDEISKQKQRWITGGLTFHISEMARIDFNYIHREELEGYKFANDAFLGMFQFNL